MVAQPYTWSDAHILAPFIVAVFLVIGFLTYEWRGRVDGMLHHTLIKDRNFPLALIAIFGEGYTFYTSNAFLAYEVSVFTSADPLPSALHFAILLGGALIFSIGIGYYSSRMKSLRWPIVVGFFFVLIFNILQCTATPATRASALWAYPVFRGVGYGFILPLIMVIAQLSTPRI